MDIKVADFNIKPIICPANLNEPNCSSCTYANMAKVHNCFSTNHGTVDFGFVDCSYIQRTIERVEELNNRGIPT